MSKRVYVWDIFVRLFHWTLVLAFVTAYISGDEVEWLHVYAGYIIAGLILFRLVWGVIGSPNARFSHFMRSPKAAIDYIRGLIKGDAKNYTGHNPAGGWMVILLLTSLTLTTLSGLQLYALEGKGPLADNAGYDFSLIQSAQASDDDDEQDKNKAAEDEAEDWWEDVHEFLA
ncbi:MAG: cytochrome b/b6 domain-containing protein, partial [gamma proteobacterium symbiont of Bathyaustriella thionipta]|nr:cytochrome b/b6 domain-containing protein [gamma proteobacterium symbiont of Bathyaustriella thionipta]